MHFSKKGALAVIALASLAALAATPASAQGLVGQSVELQYLYPTTGNVYENDGVQTVTPSGVTFNSFGEVFTTVGPSTIDLTTSVNNAFTGTDFNGVEISEIGGSPNIITGVSIDPSSTEPGFDLSRVTFDGTDVYLNLQGLVANTDHAIVDLTFGPSSVPEPSQYASMGLGAFCLMGMMLVARKRRNLA
jgi:hypothetical protein